MKKYYHPSLNYCVNQFGDLFEIDFAGNLQKSVKTFQMMSGRYRGVRLHKNPRQKYMAAHKLVWECYNGKILPDNYIVHHKDHNGLNNTPTNLSDYERREHTRLHRLGII